MSVTAIVLAGGRGARFGGDKLAAPLEGRPILHVAIEAVAPLAETVVVVGPSQGEVDLPASPPAPLRLVRDHEAFPGPLAAVAVGLEASAGDLAIVVGGDMPRLRAPVLAAMLAQLAADTNAEAVLLGTSREAKRQVLPLALRVDRSREAAAEALRSGRRSLQSMLDRLAVGEVPEAAWRSLDPDGGSLVDVDRPSDLARLTIDRQP